MAKILGPKDAAPKYQCGLDDPAHYCHCGRFGCYCIHGRWFCKPHVPDEFWNFLRTAASPKAAPSGPSNPRPDLPLMRGRI